MLFFVILFCVLPNLHYLCKQYGTKLHLDCIFHHRIRDCAGEIGVSGRLRRVPGNDGFDVLFVEDGF